MTPTSMSRKLIIRAAGLATIVALLLAAGVRGRHLTRRTARRTLRKARYLTGRARGIRYRLVHGGPPEDVSDAILVQRIRSKLGPLERRLDVPHLHVSSQDRNVSLHGVVTTADDLQQLEDTARAVSGVRGLSSHVRVGFGPGDARPSQGRVAASSMMRNELRAAARDLDLDNRDEAVGTVLSVFLHRLPSGERNHVLVHLPADVRALTHPVAPRGAGRIPDEAALRDAVTSSGAVPSEKADQLIRAVLAVLRRRVPEEIADIAAVLPTGLKPLWAEPGDDQPTGLPASEANRSGDRDRVHDPRMPPAP
jgi:uncharacterized protein (DUF2267 family)